MSPDKGEKVKPDIMPNEWFTGIGNNTLGIIVVFPSKEFAGLKDGEVGIRMNEWSHLSKNPIPDDQKEEITEKVRNASRFIKEQTGFSAEEIDSECSRLENQYKGAKEAPFSVVLGP